jgi:hypothetical protein
MDQFAGTIVLAEGAGDNEPTLGLYAAAVANGQELPEVLDIDVFFEALTDSGLRPLFTCGLFGCGGYYISVAHGADAWIWWNCYPPDDAPNPAHVIEVGRTALRLCGGTRGGDGPVNHAPHAPTGQTRRATYGGDWHRPARPPGLLSGLL